MKQKSTTGRNNIICLCAFLLYAVITLIFAATHEIWFDEAQAWQIAKYNDIAGIFRQMQYEGHPMLWHLILLPFTRAGFSPDILPFISWAFTAAAAGLIMRYAPFNTVFKCLMIFSGGFLYFNSSFSRPYCAIQLLLVLIAILFKNRDKHPVIFGLLVALLCNTHIIMCGAVGFIGIIMLISFFSGVKREGLKKNLGKAAGLLIAFGGVISMLSAVIMSLSSNNYTGVMSFSLPEMLSSFLGVPSEVFKTVLSYKSDVVLLTIVAFVLVILFCLALFFLRHYKYSLICTLIYIFTFAVFCGVIWYTVPQRSYIFIYFPVFAFWAEKECREVNVKPIKSGMLSFIEKLDSNPEKSFFAVMAIILAATMPSGLICAVWDTFAEYDSNKVVAAYLNERFTDDTVLVADTESIAGLQAYTNDNIRFYSIEHGEYFHYMPHKKADIDFTFDKIKSDLENADSVYFISIFFGKQDILPKPAENEAMFTCEGFILDESIQCIMITEFDYNTAREKYEYALENKNQSSPVTL